MKALLNELECNEQYNDDNLIRLCTSKAPPPALESLMESSQDLAKRWLYLDHDDNTRRKIEHLLRTKNDDELEKRLRKRIAFGTAGLRGSMKAGFAHMNSLTVLQASQGLAQYIQDQQHASTGGGPLSIVVGHDARYNSEKFARLTAAAFLAKGFRVLWFEKLVHTPMVPFAVKHYSTAAGVMVTASHNPKNDNGYKVYWSNGCQIIPPHDVGIATAIEREDYIITWDTTQIDENALVKPIFTEATNAYFQALQSLISIVPTAHQAPSFMYTPMHGVGLPFMKRLVGLLPCYQASIHVVQSQADPDPEFPTVPFPNPEEKGALEPAKLAAERRDCSLIVANDPDADRFAVAERLEDGQWHQFTGNQMGVLLASYVLETYEGDKARLVLLASTVSSRMLAAMATEEGCRFKETLTGFKWLGNIAQDLQQEGYDPVYAYEEAIGYMFSNVVWDKDGIAAAAVFLKACLGWKEQGLTPWQKLQELYETYGYFEDANTYLISPSPETTDKVFADIRTLNAGARPETISQHQILRWRDLTIGYDSGTADDKPDLPVDASAQMITCELENVVFTARGSGTEPKIKLYIEATAPSPGDANSLAQEVLRELLKNWFRPEYGLRLAGL